ncbi:M56 family metallopeptidase [Hyphococcus luteus]|uniref:Peptidase M56 domain-containing protein n=1 Tax=Hyphococcus luteus TaxID=2058213 RepID=A0A2S7JZ38_9PROT|nr:M56 family metallopeptidase [Marinicaulis flavus]PQA85476.1 hypothetical protein CW354_21265 [Marinicaulis flavus]
MTVIDLVRWLAETSLAVSILILLVLIIRKPFAKAFGARAAYALWLAPAARLFLPELKLLPAPVEMATAVFEPASVFYPTTTIIADAAPAFDWASLAAAVGLILWATVAFAWFSLKLELQARYRRERLAASKAPSLVLAEMAQAIARELGLRRTPVIRISKDDAAGPCVIGLFRPVVFLPAGFEDNYASREQRLALAHEIAHVARGDMAVMLAAFAFQALQWPNPLAHLSFRAFRTDQEAACDAFVLARCAKGNKAAGDYAAAILKSVRTGVKTPSHALALAHPVKERLMLLKSPKKSRLRLLAGAAAVSVFTAASLAATASYGFADEKSGEQEARAVANKTIKTTIITADGDETLNVEGVDGARKIQIEEENGARTVRIYDKDGELISENIYGPGADFPFKTVRITDEDGTEKELSIAGAKGDYMILGGDIDGEFHQLTKGMEKDVVFFSKSGKDGAMPHDFHAVGCDSEGDNLSVFVWKDEDGGDENETITREVLCLDDSEAGPEKRAEALRKTIKLMEEDAERRKEHIAKMKQELKKAEKEAKKK